VESERAKAYRELRAPTKAKLYVGGGGVLQPGGSPAGRRLRAEPAPHQALPPASPLTAPFPVHSASEGLPSMSPAWRLSSQQRCAPGRRWHTGARLPRPCASGCAPCCAFAYHPSRTSSGASTGSTWQQQQHRWQQHPVAAAAAAPVVGALPAQTQAARPAMPTHAKIYLVADYADANSDAGSSEGERWRPARPDAGPVTFLPSCVRIQTLASAAAAAAAAATAAAAVQEKGEGEG